MVDWGGGFIYIDSERRYIWRRDVPLFNRGVWDCFKMNLKKISNLNSVGIGYGGVPLVVRHKKRFHEMQWILEVRTIESYHNSYNNPNFIHQISNSNKTLSKEMQRINF